MSGLAARACSTMDSRPRASPTTCMSGSWSITARKAELSIGNPTIASITPRRELPAVVFMPGFLAASIGQWACGEPVSLP